MKNRSELTFDSGRTAEEAYQATLDKQKFLEDAGFKVETKWECALKKELKVCVFHYLMFHFCFYMFILGKQGNGRVF